MKTQEEKIEYLRKILNTLLLFNRHYSQVDLKVSGKDFMVIWSHPKVSYYSFEDITIPLSDLDTRIEHYKNKLCYGFKTRNRVK